MIRVPIQIDFKNESPYKILFNNETIVEHSQKSIGFETTFLNTVLREKLLMTNEKQKNKITLTLSNFEEESFSSFNVSLDRKFKFKTNFFAYCKAWKSD